MPDINDFHDRAEYRQWVTLHRLFHDYPAGQVIATGIGNLPQVRSHVQGNYMEKLVDDWERLLRTGNIDVIKEVVLHVNEYGRDMRQISPLYGVMTQEDWERVIEDTGSKKS